MNEKIIRHELERLESRLAWLTREADRAACQRDEVLRRLLDLDGAHDQRPTAVR